MRFVQLCLDDVRSRAGLSRNLNRNSSHVCCRAVSCDDCAPAGSRCKRGNENTEVHGQALPSIAIYVCEALEVGH